jgi:hypothetical protein
VVDKQLIALLKIIHGAFNSTLLFLFLYQGWMGLKIRRGRKASAPAMDMVKRHRMFGPLFALLGLGGYGFGLTLVYLDKGHIFEYPLHSAVGALITLSLISAFAVSRKIQGYDSPWRTPHFALGLIVIGLFVIQVLVGLSVLF